MKNYKNKENPKERGGIMELNKKLELQSTWQTLESFSSQQSYGSGTSYTARSVGTWTWPLALNKPNPIKKQN